MEWDSIKDLLETNTPFCFMKMNDGEISCIVNKSGLSRGAQDYNSQMDQILSQALVYNDKNYFIGIPCNNCYSNLYDYCIQRVNIPYPANILINSNFKKTYDLICEIFPKRKVILIVGDDADINKLPFTPEICFRVPSKNGWNHFDRLKDFHKLCEPGSIAVFCCGPLGRGLAYEWYRNNKNITCIELGSFFDPWTRGKAYQYHLGNHRKCDKCCPTNSEPIPLKLIDTCNHLERIYWNDYSVNFLKNIYGDNPTTLKNVYYICYKTPLDGEHEYFCHWNYIKFSIEELSDVDLKKQKAREYLEYALKKWPNRIEGVYEMSGYLPSEEKVKYLWKVAHVFTPDNVKYSNRDLSTWKLLDTIVNEEYWLKHYRESNKAWNILMERKNTIPESVLNHCIDNGRYSQIWIDEEQKSHKFREDLEKININIQSDTLIPRLFHFIYIAGNHPFTMSHYIAIKSCLIVQKAQQIHVWHGEETEELKNNKWWIRSKKIAKFHLVNIPAYINFNAVWWKQHQADYMRINILYKYGGVYMDLDVLSYKPLDGSELAPQFENENITDVNLFNQEMVMCRESPTKLCNCVIMVRKEHPFIKEWIYRYDTQYTQHWTLLSVETPAKIYNEHPEFNICIVKSQTFLPFIYNDFRFFYYDATNWLINNSLLIHLWDTESFKAKMIPLDEDYYINKPNNTFTLNFKKFTDMEDPELSYLTQQESPPLNELKKIDVLDDEPDFNKNLNLELSNWVPFTNTKKPLSPIKENETDDLNIASFNQIFKNVLDKLE
jgi:hypothetical protein